MNPQVQNNTDRTAANSNYCKRLEGSSHAHDPHHTDEEDDTKDVLQAWEIYSQQSAKLGFLCLQVYAEKQLFY